MLRVADVPPTPWRNGAGETRVLLEWPRSPEWLVRISVARVPAGTSTFSSFPGVDRLITVVRGDPVRLTTEGQQPVELSASARELHFFSGDIPTTAHAGAQGCEDLNIMARRGAVRVQTAWIGQRRESATAALGAFLRTPAQFSAGGAGPIAVPGMALLWWPNPGREKRVLELTTPEAEGYWIEAEQPGE